LLLSVFWEGFQVRGVMLIRSKSRLVRAKTQRTAKTQRQKYQLLAQRWSDGFKLQNTRRRFGVVILTNLEGGGRLGLATLANSVAEIALR
jgi:hypothetical protein